MRRLLISAERRVESLHSSGRTAESRLAAADAQLARIRQERDQCQRETQQQHAAAQRLERELAARSESLRAAQQAVTETETRRAALEAQVATLTAQVQGEGREWREECGCYSARVFLRLGSIWNFLSWRLFAVCSAPVSGLHRI